MGSLDGLRALVTGGASGIGAEIIRQLRAAGVTVAALDREWQRGDSGGGVPDGLVALRADLTADAEVRAAVAEAVERLGGLDILVNNAGIGAQGTIEDNPDDEWHRVLDVNVVGLVRVTRAALPALRLSPSASVVNISSVAAATGLPRRALYSASKGAVAALTQAMAVDLLPDGVRVNAVSPGTADTPWVNRLLAQADDPEAERASLEARQPHGRLVSAAEVAHAVLHLADPAAGSTTGACLTVDGGMGRLAPRPTSTKGMS